MKHPTYTIGHEANWSLIPDHMVGAVRRYFENGIQPGDFLSAVLANDLRGAVEYADDVNRDRLADYIMFFYNYCPAGSWGSLENFKGWMNKRGLGFETVYNEDGDIQIISVEEHINEPS